MSIKSNELMTNSDMINWLRTLSDGYAKPNLAKTEYGQSKVSIEGTVRETKNYMPWIMSINKRLCELSGIDCPEVPEELTEFKTRKL